MLKKISIIAFLAVSAFAMHSGEININDKDLEISARLDMGQFNDNIEPNTMFLGGKFLNADRDNSSDNPTSLDPYYEVNFLMMREIGNKGMSMGMGAKINHTKNYTTVPLGLEFSYKIPATDLIPMYLNGSLYYAPSVLSFSNAADFLEYRISYEIEVIENGRIILGYRNLDTDYEARNLNYNSSLYFGFKIGF
ncbi:MAG: YfaZ family outer membrane protein [Sulfurimonas sp.]